MTQANPITRAQCEALDAQDPLAPCRARFTLPEGVIYLDGNSLGAMPACVPARMKQAVEQEWAVGLIRSWNDADWYPAPQRVGARIAPLIGAKPGEVMDIDVTIAVSGHQITQARAVCHVGHRPAGAHLADRPAIAHPRAT